MTTDAQHQCWRRHFNNVLNIKTRFVAEEMESVHQREVRADLANIPSQLEVAKALGKLKNGKAAGTSCILPEMLKAGRENKDFVGMIAELVRTAWEEKCVPQEWVDAILVPNPKKENLHRCDNWRGITLLEVVGKVMARVVQERLQRVAEEKLPESQCGFRRRRACTDTIFTVKQLTEKAIEHTAKEFLVFSIRKHMIRCHVKVFGLHLRSWGYRRN